MGCIICLDGFGSDDDHAHRPVSLNPCGHIFHHGCVLDLLNSPAKRKATDKDVEAHKAAASQRCMHRSHSERMAVASGAAPTTANRVEPTGGSGGAVDGHERARPQGNGERAEGRLRALGRSIAQHNETHQRSSSSPNIRQGSYILICPLCKTICPVDLIIDLWPSDHDDLEMYGNFVKRDGSGPSSRLLKLNRAINEQELFNNLTTFRGYLSAYIIHTHGVDLRFIQNSGVKVLEMIERLVPDDIQKENLKNALCSLEEAAARFSNAAAEAQDAIAATWQQQAELASLQRILDQKDSELAVLAAQLADDRAQLLSDSKRMKQEKVEALQQASNLKRRATELEKKERAADSNAKRAEVALKIGLAQRDQECQKRIEEAEERVAAAQRAQAEAEVASANSRHKQEKLSESFRRLQKDLPTRKELEKENQRLRHELDALKRKRRRTEAPRPSNESTASAESRNALHSIPSTSFQNNRPDDARGLNRSDGSSTGNAIIVESGSSTADPESSPVLPSIGPSRVRASVRPAASTSISIRKGGLHALKMLAAQNSKMPRRSDPNTSNSLSVEVEDLDVELNDNDFPMQGMQVFHRSGLR
ncbi:hypothetical protein OC845_000370 [Tilletia horrida]|nr:hypothetical protein OC845_000370 [Tilletia horrida]